MTVLLFHPDIVLRLRMLILNKLLMSARHCAHALLKLLKMFH